MGSSDGKKHLGARATKNSVYVAKTPFPDFEALFFKIMNVNFLFALGDGADLLSDVGLHHEVVPWVEKARSLSMGHQGYGALKDIDTQNPNE